MSVRLLLAFTFPAILSAQNLITTIAGTDQTLVSGSSALSVPLTPGAWGKPAADSAGNIYVAIAPLNVVLRVTPAGKIEKFAGNGFARYSGDGGPAALASLNAPRDVAVDSRGVVYIADTGNKRIRRVLPTRVIDTLAGGGTVTPSANGTPLADAALSPGGALAVDGNDNLYTTIDVNSIGRIDYGASQIRLYAGIPGRPGTPASGALANVLFRLVSSLSADTAGNLYLADAGSIAIVRISPVGRVEVLTTRSATFGVPVDVAATSAGVVYFTQSASATIWRYQSNTAVDAFAGDVEREGYTPSGTARERSLFGNELRIGLDPQNNIIVGDNRNGRLRRVSTVVDTIAGSDLLFSGEGAPATAGVFYSPSYVAQSRAGTYYFSDAASRLVFSIDSRGTLRRFAGTGVLGAGYTDGRAALEGSFGTPYGVAVDSSGAVYIADDDCAIRRIGSDGAMRLFAGLPGLCANPTDGSVAKDARFGRLRGLTFDAAGNLFATDISYHKVWRIGADGIVRTFAGTGLPGTSTNSLPAFQTPLNTPLSVAVAADNTVFIADSGNNRILRIGSDNRSTNYAGVGQRASTGDNGPAASAAVSQPAGLALDRDGNLYLSELAGHRIRRINANGIISTFAGIGVGGFRGDGGLALNALINGPAGLLLNSDGALVIADRDNGRLRLVLGTTPVVRIPTAPITLAMTPGTYSQRGTVELPSPISGLAFEASVRYSGSASGWLTLTPPRGTLPATLIYEANSAGLAAGDYSAQIVITTTSATPRETSIPFTLRVPAPPAVPALTVGNTRLTLSALRGAATAVSVPVVNSSGVPLTVRSLVTRGDFLTVEPASLIVPPGQTASFTLTATANLAPGTYFGAASFTAGTLTSNVAVAFTVSAIRSRLQLSQTGLSFRAVAGASAPPPQVLYGSLPRLGARAVTISGAPWITASAEESRVSVAVDPRGLAAGDYYGRLEVFDAANPEVRQFVTVLMQVLPAGSDPGPEVVPSALLYTAPVGGEVAGQDVQVYRPGNRRAAFTVSGATFEGQPWLRFGPAAGAVSGDTPASFTVQPDLTGLNAGVYRGSVTLTLENGQTRTVAILAVITPSVSRTGKTEERMAASCSSPNLFPQVIAPAPNFVATVGEPVRLAVRAVDGCGNLHQPESGGTAGVAVTGFGTQVINLTHIGAGVWEGTVTPNAAQSAITLTYLALFSRGASLQAGADKVNGAIITAPRPVVFSNALADAASFQFGSPVGPGTLISLFGDNLSASNAQPSALPLPSRLGDVEVRLNDQPIPLLFAGPGQVNAQIPYSVAGDAEYQLEIRRGSALTTPQPVVIAQARPGVFTVDLSGQGQGHIYRALTNGSQVLADAANPVGAGDVLVIYCNGLGATSPGVNAGDAAPFSPLAFTANPVTLTIGGQPASIAFAGLAPGFAGLYQVNAVVPAGVTPGPAVPVVLTVASQSSVPVTIGVR